LDEKGLIHFPVLFIYEEHHVVDFIQDFCETDTLGDHLARMFPGDDFPDWDIARKYVYNVLEVYSVLNHTKPLNKNIENQKRKRKVKLRHESQIIKLLTHPEYIVPGMPVFYIVRKDTKTKSQFLISDIDDLGKYI